MIYALVTLAVYLATVGAMIFLGRRLYHQTTKPAAPTEWLEAVMTKRIIVHLTGPDMTIDGSLVARMDDGIVLRAARLMDGSPQGTAMKGEVFVPREKVAFAQLDG